jgi:hypothetical protein
MIGLRAPVDRMNVCRTSPCANYAMFSISLQDVAIQTPRQCSNVIILHLKLNFQLRLRCACAATAMRERCDFHRSTIAIGNTFIGYTVFIPRIRTRIAIAAHAHRSRNWKLSLSDASFAATGCGKYESKRQSHLFAAVRYAESYIILLYTLRR